MAALLSGGALPIFSFRGIAVRLHWSFALLPAYVLYTDLRDGDSWGSIAMHLGMVGITFACVVLHEFGHALTARRYGIGTKAITLLPIGGVAALERMPEEPRQEFWITVAGPAVNLAIALLALLLMAALGLTAFFTDLFLGGASAFTNLLLFLAAINVWLFLFNLIPAFPMDGGRILRSALALRMPRVKATRIAANLGRAVAIGGMAYGLLQGEPMLALVGFFVFTAAGAEARQAEQREGLRGIKVSEVMRNRFWSPSALITVREATRELLQGGDTAMVVLGLDGLPVGVLHKRDLIAAVEAGKADARLGDLPPHPARVLSIEDDAHESIQHMLATRLPLLPVVQDRRVIGVLELENLEEYMRLRKAQGGEASN